MKIFDELKYRNMIKDVSNLELAEKLLNDKKIVFYCGFDPTATSLTIGHLVQVMRICLLQKNGHRPIVLVGGATGLIGDPREVGERKLLTLEDSLANAEKIKEQLSKYIDFDSENGAILVNNYDWISKISTIEFLRDYGKYFNLNYMLSKDVVAKRLETGISYTEFSYMLIQSIDFLHLYKEYNCQLQFGGSDQWGNITSGLELIRKTMTDKEEVVGMSSPLLLKADGTKFGKSESGALWLDEELTSPYEILQYFLNSSDNDVINYLKTLTLLKPEEISDLEIKIKEHPELREAQKQLAKEVVTFLHGEEAYLNALRITDILFNGDIKSLTGKELEVSFKDVPNITINKDINIVDLLILCNDVASKREAREFINNGAILVNGEKVLIEDTVITKDILVDNKFIVLKRGKKKYYLIRYE